jgi:hypothetical protein
MSEPTRAGVPTRYCLGCRAVLDLPPQAEDRWGLFQTPPNGFTTEAVECARCGVLDVFLVALSPERRAAIDGPMMPDRSPVLERKNGSINQVRRC